MGLVSRRTEGLVLSVDRLDDLGSGTIYVAVHKIGLYTLGDILSPRTSPSM